METILQTGLSNAIVASALALVAVLIGFFYRRPALVHGLWLLVLLKLVTPPILPIPIAWPASAAQESVLDSAPSDTSLSPIFLVEAAPDDAEPANPLPRADGNGEQSVACGDEPSVAAAPPVSFPWQTLVAGFWLLGSAGWFLLAGWRVWRFRRWLRFATPAPESLRRVTERLARKMGTPACPPVYLIPGRLAPMLWAAGGKASLLVPRELLGQLTKEQQETLLAHELAHWRRRDHWVRGLEFLAMGLFWWHPVVWYGRRELREAEEECCDAWVVSLLPGAGKTYATALLETLDFLSNARPATPLLASGIGHVSDLKRRLTMIMTGTTPRSLSWRGTMLVLGLGLLALPLLPTLVRAQTEQIQKEVEFKLDGLRFELGNADDAKMRAELEKARAEVAMLQATLNQKLAHLKAMEAKLAAMKGGKGDDKGKDQGILHLKLQGNKGQPGQTEITLRKVGDHWEVVQPGGKPGVILWNVEGKQGGFKIGPAAAPKPPQEGIPFKIEFAPTPPTPPKPPAPPGKAGPAVKSEGRIDQLEKQLQQIMKELESLRKDMKQPKSGNSGLKSGEGVFEIELDLKDLKLIEEKGKTPKGEKPTPKP